MGGLMLILSVAAIALCAFCLALIFGRVILANMGFYRRQFSASAEVELADMFIFASGQQLFVFNLMLLVFVPLFLHVLFDILVLTVAGAILTLFVPGMFFRMLKRKRLMKFEEQLPDAFMLLSSSLQSGASLNMALENVVQQSPAPLSQEFGLLVKKLRLGVTLEDALVKMEERIPLPSFIMASSAVRISREVGGNLVETINGMATMLRRKKVMEGKIDSLTSQGRAQGIFMAMLPIFLAGILSAIEPEAMSQLYTTRVGLMVLAVMVVMEVLGFLFIKKITRIDA
ncbi:MULTISPECIES: type II secretion system F family protein [unclassified Pseudomonas]|uniref:type II secretion system F family protein n=1 Tax=unclassified Pseudomonas TaxID=196821 RepID=UPI00244A6C24|nr:MULTISPECIES: type II secretion system F family protein [unclassified Pseudomonas]MDG9924864.1 type II secretion system F family protein [Pseudomonas sp. GD04045]MDH0036145.1 type II secretion system F family protein [Pseudomonas sp. GD04019]